MEQIGGTADAPPRRWARGRAELADQLGLAGHLLRWAGLGCAVGAVAGLASAGFLSALDEVTAVRTDHPGLLFGLPLVGLAIGLAYHQLGGRAAGGNNLILDEIHEPTAWVPRRMAPLVLLGTLATHLFGGSAGREGTAIQVSGSLTDVLARVLRLGPADRRVLLIAAIAGGFGSVFGVPLAGAVFGLEVQAVGRLRYEALVPALAASVVGDLVVRGVGVGHTAYPQLPTIELSAALVAKVALAGIAFGLVSAVFAELVHALKGLAASRISWAPARPVVGGVLVIGLTLAVGSRDYLGLSLPLLSDALAGGAGVGGGAFALKLIFTAVTLGSGFQGGEVTPLFVIGATLGVTLAGVLDVPVPVLAAVGVVAVFAGATNTPLACTIMGVELFGPGALVLYGVGCVVAYVASGHRSIYGRQRVVARKGQVAADVADGGALVVEDRRWARVASRRAERRPPTPSARRGRRWRPGIGRGAARSG